MEQGNVKVGVASLDNLRHKSSKEPARMDLNGLAYGLEFLQHARADPDANHGVEFVGHAKERPPDLAGNDPEVLLQLTRGGEFVEPPSER
jgi:hypothetical protein